MISGTDHKEEDEDSDLGSPNSKKKKRKPSKVQTKVFDGMGSSLIQIPIPEGLQSQTYGSLYEHLSEKGMIPLGLLRGVFPTMNVGPKGNKMPYVATNPPARAEVFSCDKVFVLSQKLLRSDKTPEVVFCCIMNSRYNFKMIYLIIGYSREFRCSHCKCD